MAFEFILSTDEIREKMFDFIKPVYKEVCDWDVEFIDWVYGVYDSEIKFFITLVPHPHQCTNENESKDTNE